MRHSRTITFEEYRKCVTRYWALVNSLPESLRRQFPSIKQFLSPANWSSFHPDDNDIELSITGIKRFDLLKSPHAATLLAAWAAQRLPVNDNES